jgi:transposase
MPKLLQARPALDVREARQVRKLATSTHAPADWIAHARMIVRSWEGQRTRGLAAALHCHPQTVGERLHAFNARGLDGLGMRPGSGRKPRLSAAERSALIALARTPPPGKLVPAPARGELLARDAAKAPAWTLDSLTAGARAQGSQVARSPLRRILRRDGVRWRRTRLWATSHDADFAPKGRRSSPATPRHRRGRRSSVSMNSGREAPAPFRPLRAGPPTGTAARRRWNPVAAVTRPGCLARDACATDRRSPRRPPRATPPASASCSKPLPAPTPRASST